MSNFSKGTFTERVRSGVSGAATLIAGASTAMAIGVRKTTSITFCVPAGAGNSIYIKDNASGTVEGVEIQPGTCGRVNVRGSASPAGSLTLYGLNPGAGNINITYFVESYI